MKVNIPPSLTARADIIYSDNHWQSVGYRIILEFGSYEIATWVEMFDKLGNEGIYRYEDNEEELEEYVSAYVADKLKKKWF